MIFKFGRYELDDSARELRADGQIVETEPKAFDLLVYLLRHRDRAVSKDEILESLWPDQIVSETALSRAIMKARRAVGDDPSAQAVIRTLHGHGYRFVAKLDCGDFGPPSAGTAPTAAPAHRRRRPMWIAAAAIIVVGIGALLFVGRETPVRLEPGTLAVLPVHNANEAEEADWVRLGLMSLMRRMLDEGGISVASDGRVLAAVDGVALARPPGPELVEQIRTRTGANSVLYTTLELKGGLNRLTAVVTHADGTRSRRIIVGQSPAGIAADLANVIVGIVSDPDANSSERFSVVSTDPFVNELYARALDLELRGEIAEARDMFRLAVAEEPELFWPRYEIALCTRDLGEHDEAERMFEALLEEARRGGDARAVVATLNSHGRQKLDLLAFDEAEAMFQEGLAAIGERALPREKTVLLANLALVDSWQGNDIGAAEHYEAIMATYTDSGMEPSALFLNNYAGLLNRLGKSEQARVMSEQAVAGFRVLGQRRYEAPALNRLANINRQLGNYETALHLHTQSAAIYSELGNVQGELSVRSGITAVYRDTGDLTRARRNAEDLLEGALALSDDPWPVADGYLQLAHVEAADARYSRAIALFGKSAAAFEAIDDARGVRESQIGIARASIALGDSATAHALSAAMRDAAGDDKSATAHGHWISGRAHLADSNLRAAREAFMQALDYARLNGDTLVLSFAGAGLAESSLVSEELEDARRYLEEIRPHAGAEHDFKRLDARLTLAEGDAERAAEMLTALRTSAGESWKDDDEALLAELRQHAQSRH